MLIQRIWKWAALLGLVGSPAAAQFPRLAPPPPCRAAAPSIQPMLAFWGDDRARDRRPRVAVFPLEPEIDDPARVYLSNSLPDRVRQRLAMDSRVHVATEGSVSRAMVASRQRRDSAALAIGAEYRLTGRVYVSGNRQEVALALIRLGRPDTTWQATFRATTTVRAMEDAIVSGIERALDLGNPPSIPRTWPSSEDAFEAVVAGDASMRSVSGAAADSALVLYQQALELEPASPVALSRTALASVAILERGGEIPGFSGRGAMDRVESLAARALAADSGSAEAWTVRARLARVTDPVRFEGAVAAHRRAIAADPRDADAEHEYGVTLMRLGDTRGAEPHFRRALQLEPSRASTLAALGAIELRAERWAEACGYTNASIAAWPFAPMPYAIRARARLQLADARDAYSDAELVRRLTSGVWPEALRVLVAAGAGNIETARQLTMQLTAAFLAPGRALSVRDAEYLALAYLQTGDRRRAVESLKRAQPVGADLGLALRGPGLAPIKADTAVVRLLKESAGPRDD